MHVRILYSLLMLISLASCGGSSTSNPVPITPPIQPPIITKPVINEIQVNAQSIGMYEKIEWSIDASADYNNPFDQREVSLDGQFIAPNNKQINIAGYWDARTGWVIRFAPSEQGEWQYSFSITDKSGVSDALSGTFNVTTSTNKGWIQAANKINPTYSPHYFAHQDGSEFYGIGHGDVFSIFRNSSTTTRLLARMKAANENYFVWWPQFYFSLVSNNYNNYNQGNIELIDEVITQTEQANLKLVFTLWDHSQLRDSTHAWSDGRWNTNNGFSQLINASDFFTNEQAWQWQENLYRYIIARWGYSSAIAMWQTVAEIDGTNAYDQTNVWHQRINNYFVENDPYRHPTTASKSGDLTWPAGNAVMDSPQVHIYRDLLTDRDNPTSPAKIIDSAQIIASYTQAMWQTQEKPNWIGEFGVINHPTNEAENSYPEVFHYALWSALAAGAAMTPAEWNDFSQWGQVTSSMQTTLQHFSRFVQTLSLAKWKPNPLTINTPVDIKAWGIAGQHGGLIWLQDTRLSGKTIVDIRDQQSLYPAFILEVVGLEAGQYNLIPYETRLGMFLPTKALTCETNIPCLIEVDSFNGDIAFKIEASSSL